MTDPRYIFEVTGQMSQYGPWGIRLPDGPGQTDATLYFKSREEAEEYVREHPVQEPVGPPVRRKSVPLEQISAPIYSAEPPIPPTSAPWREGGYAPPEEE